jgi:hypothetical protein
MCLEFISFKTCRDTHSFSIVEMGKTQSLGSSLRHSMRRSLATPSNPQIKHRKGVVMTPPQHLTQIHHKVHTDACKRPTTATCARKLLKIPPRQQPASKQFLELTSPSLWDEQPLLAYINLFRAFKEGLWRPRLEFHEPHTRMR